VEDNLRFIYQLAGVEKIGFASAEHEKGYIKTAAGGFDIYIYILEAVDIDLEIQRINDEIKKNCLIMEKSKKKLENPGFMENAPSEVIDKEKNKLKQSQEIAETLTGQLDKMVRINK
jgi:valyl-tRNA synthetase